MVATLNENIRVYDENKERIETDHNGEWIVVYDLEIIGYFDDLQEAAHMAVTRYGDGPYLIRHVGMPSPRLPASYAVRGITVA